MPIPVFIVRKEAKGHGTGNFIEGKTVSGGDYEGAMAARGGSSFFFLANE